MQTIGRLIRHHPAHAIILLLLISVLAGVWYGLPVTPRFSWTVPEPCRICELSADGRTVVTENNHNFRRLQAHESPLRNEVLRIWDASSGTQRLAFHTANDQQSFGHVELAPDGRLIVFEDPEEPATLRVVDIANGATLTRLRRNDPCSLGFRFSPNGRTLVYQDSSEVHLWNVTTRRESPVLPTCALGFDFSADGQFLTTAEGDNVIIASELPRSIAVWHVETGCLCGRITLPRPNGGCLAGMGTDGKLLFAAINSPFNRDDATAVHVWDVETGRVMESWRADCDRHCDAGVCALRDRFAVASAQADLAILDLMTGRERGKVPGWNHGSGVLLPGYCCPVTIRECSPDGRTLAQLRRKRDELSPALQWLWNLLQLQKKRSDYDCEVALWDVARGRAMAALPAKEDFSFSADGKFLAVQPDDSTVQIWDIPPRKPLGWFTAIAGALLAACLTGMWWTHRRTVARISNDAIECTAA